MEFVITWRERSRNGRADGNPTDQMHLFQNLLFQLTQLDKMLAVQKQESVVNPVWSSEFPHRDPWECDLWILVVENDW
jgi:hypothetical protein